MKPPLRQGGPNDFQTPPWALKPLLPHLKPGWIIWECACGDENLADELHSLGFPVIATDITQGKDFLRWQPKRFDCIITNPPFRYKQQFLERCYQLGRPFALLLPLTALETRKRQELFHKYGVEIIRLDKRVDFTTPRGMRCGSSWFATAWFTHKLEIGRQLFFGSLQSSQRRRSVLNSNFANPSHL